MDANPLFQTSSELFLDWKDDVLTGNPSVSFPIGTGVFEQIEICPERISLFGGAPGAGKTALVMQFVVDALRSNGSLRAVICNVEMPPVALLDRQLARLSGVDGGQIRRRESLRSHSERINSGLATLEGVSSRLCFLRAPFTLRRVAEAVNAFNADLLVLDYLQRIPIDDEGGDQRRSVNLAMNRLRAFADTGLAVMAVAAVGRVRDAQGRSSYDGNSLNLASFRESSELEYGADDAYLLVPSSGTQDLVELRQVKSRYGEQRTIPLRFHRACQRFGPFETSPIPVGEVR